MAILRIIQGDITRLKTDAIVNAANHTLLGGSGVDGAIHSAAGPQLLEACKSLGGCPTGEARITKGYRLPAKFVIHTVGPVWRGGNHQEARLLYRCYQNSLLLAADHQIKTIAFPAISTGAYAYPFDKAGRIALQAVYEFTEQHVCPEEITFVLFNSSDYARFQNIYRKFHLRKSDPL